MTSDPFGTGRLREAALAAWAGHPARFREDANAEEDHGRGYYRDRVVVELAQNAADAATRAGMPGRLLLRLTTSPAGPVLVAANTGSPLDAAGVASLASLRASAKRADASTVGRFGVGFAAVRSVADEITVASAPGAVHFSQRAATDLLEHSQADLAAEVARRHGSLPVLRLPFPGPGPGPVGRSTESEVAADGRPTGGWDTVVVLTLRDDDAVREVRRQLAAVDDPLLLALPSLASIEVQDDGARVVQDVASRWVVATRTGVLDPALLADRPVEERERRGWQVTWAVRRGGPTAWDGPTASTQWRTVHAPTPTDEPCTVPALLVATFPLDPSRRHVVAGALTDALVGCAGDVWTDLVAACRDARSTEQQLDDGAPMPSGAPDPLDLLPANLPASALDAALRAVVVAATRTVPLLSPVDGGPPLAPPEAVVLPGAVGQDRTVLSALGEWLPHLVEVAPRHRHLVDLLGMGRTDLTEIVDALPHTDPGGHRRVYVAFEGVDAAILEELATLPVPLADGRTVRGARGLVLLDDTVDASTVESLCAWGIRAVHPGAAHPLLERLGAVRAGSASLLHHPVVRERVLAAGDADDAGLDDGPDGDPQVAEVLLGLVRAALQDGLPLDEEPWWGEVLLPDDEGELAPARGLVMPGSDAARWFDPDVLPPVGPSTAQRWTRELPVLGVRTGLTVAQLGAAPDAGSRADVDGSWDAGGPGDVDLVTDALDGWQDYLEDVIGQVCADLVDGSFEVPEMAVVADLDAVRDDAWPEVLRALARGEARHALVDPVRISSSVVPSGRLVPYTAWWLRRRSGLGLDRPFALPDVPAYADATAGGTDAGPGVLRGLGALLAPVPALVAGLDVEVLRALGGVTTAAELDADGWADVLAALPAIGEPVPAPLATDLWRGLADLAQRDEGVELDPDRLPALIAPGRVAVVATEDLAVGSPQWAQHPLARPMMLVPAGAVAALADALDVDTAAERIGGDVTSVGREVPTPPVVSAAFPGAPASWVEHEDLRVDDVEVDWWVDDEDTVHAATTAGLARALAALLGWSHRDALERLLTDPGSLDDVVLDLAGEPGGA